MNAREKEFKRRYEEMGDLLRICRNKKKLTQEQLAALSHIRKKYIQYIEKGECNITLMVYFKICEALDVEPCELVRESWSLTKPVWGKTSKWTMNYANIKSADGNERK